MDKAVEDLNLSFLLEHERETILKVLQKDEKLRKREEKRIRKLKNDLLEIKRKGSRRLQDSEERQCARCLKTLGLIFDRGDLCEECQLRVCSECRTTTAGSRRWRCNVCAKISELKVVTGEWFLEERSRRFEQKALSSDVIKQSILSTPPSKSGENLSVSSETERPDTPKSNRNAVRNIMDGARKKGGVAVALESSGLPTLPNNLRSQTPDKSPNSTNNRRPDGAESVASVRSSECLSEKEGTGHHRTNSDTPTISVSRASVSSDHSRSEMDLSAPGSEHSDDALSLRSRSVPGLNEAVKEDIDALMSAHSLSRGGGLSNASSLNSMMSMYSETGDYGNARVSGEILLNISYSYKTGALNVLVKKCYNLATGDERRQRTDAYVKTYLLPDTSRQSKRKTSIRPNTVNPVFNENLRYVISHSQLETRTLQVSVWHHDRFGYNSFLGEVELTFDSWEFDSQIEEWYTLQPRVDSCNDSAMQYKGELTVVLKYIPAEKNLMLPLDQVQVKKSFLKGKKTSSFMLPKGGMVELLVKGAKNLTAVKSGGTSDPFVKGYLLPDNNKSTKHKTAVERRTVNPQWNHTFTYCGLQDGDLDNICLELTVWDKEALSSNVFLGGVRLGAGSGKSYGKEVDWMDSYGEEKEVWQRMVENPEVPQECTLMLRSSMRKCNT
uniref:Synaptotagmin-like protein 5 n=1 Tax=Cyprinodon variegatus TaxID=28743 RepID=A0A3Q2D0W2_CYPVA